GQVMYNKASGGCYDGLEEHNVNLNQGAESAVCYLLARTIMERRRRAVEQRGQARQRLRVAGPRRGPWPERTGSSRTLAGGMSR
ncbi:MAG TPA: hypothetical protein VKG92_11920, partial [Flavobacteriales bacterium]|nr:hypothetical protein [Flavobacteriales bacterium]